MESKTASPARSAKPSQTLRSSDGETPAAKPYDKLSKESIHYLFEKDTPAAKPSAAAVPVSYDKGELGKDSVRCLFEKEPLTAKPMAAALDSSYDKGELSKEELSKDSVRCLFEKAYEYLRPGPLFRRVVHLFAERKLLVVFLIHFCCTMIIWCKFCRVLACLFFLRFVSFPIFCCFDTVHFGFIKFQQQKESVPEIAPNYWWKRVVPPLEFGSMHAILFQMALIPLTMSRYTISVLCDTIVNRFVPLNRALRMHIHLGYTMVLIVFLATVFFLIFFGVLCARGEDDFCAKFTSEIMCTGYGILASLLIIAGTSYFRYRIPYEVFYAIHHLVFAMYAITVAHTFDIMQRNNHKERSQTFKWFSATLLYYICDRAAMRLNQTYCARLLSSSLVTGSRRSRMMLLKIQRPALFRFRPGQYAYLKLGRIDPHWHPFSIASEPESKCLEFYVEVFDDKSWTGKLWTLLQEDTTSDGTSLRQINIEVMGPFGTSLAKTDDFSHVFAVGTGTGM